MKMAEQLFYMSGRSIKSWVEDKSWRIFSLVLVDDTAPTFGHTSTQVPPLAELHQVILRRLMSAVLDENSWGGWAESCWVNNHSAPAPAVFRRGKGRRCGRRRSCVWWGRPWLIGQSPLFTQGNILKRLIYSVKMAFFHFSNFSKKKRNVDYRLGGSYRDSNCAGPPFYP